jgi:hypothetical protein
MMETLVTEKELQLLLELLQNERHELGPEIHHTTSMKVKEELRERMHAVERLIKRLQEHLAEQRSIIE